MEIRVVPATRNAARSQELVARRPGAWSRRLRGIRGAPGFVAALNWPLDLAVATAEVRLPFRAPRTIQIPLARDAVTGRQGELDRPLPERETIDAPDPQIVADHAGWDGEELREFAREQFVRRCRPTEIRGLRFEERERVHLPYHLVREAHQLFLVDLLAGRVERAHEYPGVRTADGATLPAVSRSTV